MLVTDVGVSNLMTDVFNDRFNTLTNSYSLPSVIFLNHFDLGGHRSKLGGQRVKMISRKIQS